MQRKKCPYCGEDIAATAKKCRYCGEWLTENEDQSSAPAQPTSTQPAAAPAQEVVTPAQPTSAQPVAAPAQPAQQGFASAPAQPTTAGKSNSDKEDPRSFLQEYVVGQLIRRYADFSGFASRKTFWMTYLAMCVLSFGIAGIALIIMGIAGVAGVTAGCIITGLFGLALVLPQLAISCRRLRDAGKSPYLIFLGLIPLVGQIILLVFFCQPTHYYDPETNELVDKPNNPPVTCSTIDVGVIGSCFVLFVFGGIIVFNSIGELLGGNFSASEYDLGDYTEQMEYNPDSDEWDEAVVEEVAVADNSTLTSLEQIADIDPDFFSYELETYRIGSDSNLNNLMESTGSTNVPIRASGMISDHNVTMEGWLTENGTIHGRYHNDNGVNLDFNGYIRPDKSLYIQLGHDGEKSEWNLHPVASELSAGQVRYEGTWGKKQLDSYLIFR